MDVLQTLSIFDLTDFKINTNFEKNLRKITDVNLAAV